jgi:5-formyltetrahydrofolate cyclo-ligase
LRALIEERLNLPDRLQRADLLQRVMRIWLVNRPDTVIGAYWPIKGEFDPLPALHRWKEDGELLDEPQRRRIGLPVVDKVHKTLTFPCLVPRLPHGRRRLRHPQTQGHRGHRAHAAVCALRGLWAGGYRWAMAAAFTTARWPRCSPSPFTVGLGFTQGFLDDFEPEAHDLPLDAILNDNGVVWPV